MRTELLASNPSFVPFGVGATDADRSSLAVSDRRRALRLLDGETLAVLERWQLTDAAIGTHAIRPRDRTVLVSGADAVELLDPGGEKLWTSAHPRWEGAFARGCAWFDEEGRAFAVVPSHDYDGCDVVHLSLASGEVLHRAGIATAPDGLHAIHQSDGWVGLSVGEGQDGAYAWWVRLRDDGLEILDGGWSDEVLFDADAAGRHILTTPHALGPIRIRSFPELDIVREIQPPAGYWWDFYACFVGKHVVARAIADTDQGDGILVAIVPDGTIVRLGRSEDPISPGPHGSWIANGERGIERWRLLLPQ